MAGTKHDADKPDYTLIPREAKDAIARALMYGAQKYSRDNYKEGIEWLRMAAACERHLTAWVHGEELDPESGLCHLDHALATLAMLAFHVARRPNMDNRVNACIPTTPRYQYRPQHTATLNTLEANLVRGTVTLTNPKMDPIT